jgi:predicted membrane-bound spermidine synthase
MIDLATKNGTFTRINGNVMKDPRVTVIAGDAYRYYLKGWRYSD